MLNSIEKVLASIRCAKCRSKEAKKVRICQRPVNDLIVCCLQTYNQPNLSTENWHGDRELAAIHVEGERGKD